METRFNKCVTILVLLEHTFVRSQLHGHFSFNGFVNKSLISNKIIVKSKLKCSSMCFENDDCYFFDFCKTGTSASCYLHNKDIANMSLLENGECRRYGLVIIINLMNLLGKCTYEATYLTTPYLILNYLFSYKQF